VSEKVSIAEVMNKGRERWITRWQPSQT